MRCLSFFGHPCLCLQIPSFQGLGGIFTRWILAMPGTLRSFFAAIRGGFSSLLLGTLFGMRVLRLAHQKQASCLLLPSRLRSLSPPPMAAFLRYRLSALFGSRVYDSPPRYRVAKMHAPLLPPCIRKKSSKISSKS